MHEASWYGPIVDPTACKVTRRSSRNDTNSEPDQIQAGKSREATSHGALTIKPSCKDEMRVGQKNKLTYRWARKGSRPRAAHDQCTQSTYLFGAVCPEQGKGSGLVLPACNAEAMQLHLDDIAAKVAPCAHPILVFDLAGWHGAKALKIPPNLSLMPLPPRSPELNPKKTSGYSCARTGCRTACSNPMMTSSITVATPGTPSISPGRSCPSPAATGRQSVSHCEEWCKFR